MKAYNKLTDDAGVEWEFHYTEDMFVPVLDPLGEPVLDAEGNPKTTSRITNLVYNRVAVASQREFLRLPPWADIKEEWKITLGFFDEDDDTDEMTFWEVSS